MPTQDILKFLDIVQLNKDIQVEFKKIMKEAAKGHKDAVAGVLSDFAKKQQCFFTAQEWKDFINEVQPYITK